MIDFIRINGTALRLASARVRETPGSDGTPRRDWLLVAIVRGLPAQRDLLDLLAARSYTVEAPREEGWEHFPATLVDHTFSETTIGSNPVFRHLVTLREGNGREPGSCNPGSDADVAAALDQLERLVRNGRVDRETLLREIRLRFRD